MVINNYEELEKIQEINNLFKKKNYKSIIGSKYDTESIAQKICYYNADNILEQFIINIINSNNIEVQVPLYNTNFYYKTRVNTIVDLYNYLLLHL